MAPAYHRVAGADPHPTSPVLPQPALVRPRGAHSRIRLIDPLGRRGRRLVAVQDEKLPNKARATRLKLYWTERLGALEEVLGSGGKAERRWGGRAVAG
jgi:hypothetical protein